MRQTIVLAALSFCLALGACSEEDPSIRVRNDRTNKANTQIKPSSGNTFNINDVAGGATSAYITIPSGRVEATSSIQSESESPTLVFTAEMDKNYTVVIRNTTPPTLSVESSDK